MIGVCLLAMLSTTSFAAIGRTPSATNSTTLRTTPISISPKLRKALIEALNNYDADEDSTEANDDETTTFSSSTDETESETTTDNPSSVIKIHTFSIDGDNSDENEVIKTIIITRPKTTLTPPRPVLEDQVQIKFGKAIDPVNEESDKSNNTQQVRSVESRNPSNTSEKKEEKSKKKASEKSVTKPLTLPLITTTTTLAPVTNADGQNIEKVAKDGVKIQQAPLLAAFTVQQDANGTPQKVISLLRNSQIGNSQSTSDGKHIVNLQFRASQPAVPTLAPSSQTTTVQVTPSFTSSSTSSLATSDPSREIIKSFEEKQRLLEEQIRLLQARQREQDEIIRRHNYLQDQANRQKFEQQRLKFEEDQRQQQLEEQRRRQRNEQEQQILRQQQIQAQAVQQPQAQALVAPPSSVNVQFIPSIAVGHTVGISVEQQPPFKDATEFHPENPNVQKSIQRFQFRQFQQNQQRNNAAFGPQQQQQPQQQQSVIQKVEVQQIPAASPLPTNLELPVRNHQIFNQNPVPQNLPTSLELPQKQFQQFNNQQQQQQLPPLTDIIPPSQTRPRVFRNDALQTGNFGFNNNNQNNVQIQRQQLHSFDQSIDNQLFNQFLQHGINTRSAEDFRIISKILSYNHGTNPQQDQQVVFANHHLHHHQG